MTHHATYPPALDDTSADGPSGAVPPAPGPAPGAPGDAPDAPLAAPDARVGAPAGVAGVQTAGMRDVLTDDHSKAGGVPTAGAAPAAAGATPAAGEATPATAGSAPAAQGLGGPRVPGDGRGGVPTAPAAPVGGPAAGEAGQAAPGTAGAALAGAGRGPGHLGLWPGRILAGVIALGMLVVAGVGFASSYDTLRVAAEIKGFSHALSYWVPIGIDGAILAFLALDLYLTHRRIPKPLLRLAAHGMTLATVVLNATSGGKGGTSVAEDPVRALWHGLMPCLFVVGVEALRHLVLHAAQIEDGTATERIPLHRWLLAPAATARLYRRMRLAAVRSYDEMVKREQDLEGYRVWLKQELGGDLSKATDVQLLPLTMAPKGFTVEQALALPAQWEAEAAERARAEEERRALAEAEAAEREAELEIKKAAAAGRVEAARHQITAQTGTAAAQAEAQTERARAEAERARAEAERVRRLAERQTDIEAEAWEQADVAAAKRRAKEDELAAEKAAADAEAERRRRERERLAAEAEEEAEETERAAEAKRRAAEHDLARIKAEREALEERARADAARRAAEIEEEALETERAAAAKRRAKEDELEAAKAEAATEEAEAKAAREKALKAQAIRDTEKATAEAEAARVRAAEARRRIAVLEAEAATADDWADLTPRQRKARRVARMILAAGGTADHVDVVELKEIEAVVGVGRTTAGELRQEAKELLAGGYNPMADYAPQS